VDFRPTKRCSVCRATKELDEFPVDKTKADGRMYRCRDCDNARSRRYYEANRDAVRERASARAQAKPPRSCKVCRQPTPSARHSYCDRCRPAAARGRERRRNRQRNRPSSAEQGYGYAHKQLRKRVAAVVEAGRAACARCGEPIRSDEPWDLGHDDNDRSLYSGPEHRCCNRATSGRPKKQVASGRW
jgi:hypothetical protein